MTLTDDTDPHRRRPVQQHVEPEPDAPLARRAMTRNQAAAFLADCGWDRTSIDLLLRRETRAGRPTYAYRGPIEVKHHGTVIELVE